ncbi:ATP-dependent DNA ligase [Cryobacterium ruanii]|uniref:ATP-dependent DNA ligase n=1 Tax=Cryobacterium ruanii TaxID=1259197 RepID=A0A4R9AJZ8_9MICO|nr:ATP-dependent DNA ligase [Cryobacterium ruanii]TFD63470.1 ATP-dependent DNA ligase [Cryobacterium ruanii]
MGTLLYGNPGIVISFDDRALMHLQIVISTKLRRRESFVFTWTDSADEGSGRSAIWLDPTSTLYYRYFGCHTPSINRDWIETLMLSANSTGGLVLIAEPEPAPPALSKTRR